MVFFYVNDSLSNKDMLCLKQIDLFTAILIYNSNLTIQTQSKRYSFVYNY